MHGPIYIYIYIYILDTFVNTFYRFNLLEYNFTLHIILDCHQNISLVYG